MAEKTTYTHGTTPAHGCEPTPASNTSSAFLTSNTSSQPSDGSSQLLKSRYILFWFLFLTALASIVAYYQILTGFSIWDDEGSLMLSVRQFLAGMKLYDQVPNYGPVYYFYEWFLHTLSGTPVTHDVVRISSLVPWLLTALVCAWIVLRLTRSLFLASATHILSFWALSFFRDDPGHPQELCILLTVALVASGIWAAVPRWRWLAMIFLGSFTAALLLIKVNIGVFMMLAVSLVVLSSVPRTIFSRTLFLAVAIASVILPFILMKAHLDEPVAQRYCVAVMASTIAMLFVLDIPRTPSLSFRDFWLALVSFTCVIVAVLLVLIVALRITPYGILNSLVLANLRVSVSAGKWYVPVRLPWIYVPSILSGLAAAIFHVRTAEENRTRRLLLGLKFILFPASAVSLLFGRSLLGLVTPFCWLVLCVPKEEVRDPTDGVRFPQNDDRQAQFFPRALLCSVTVLQTLYAYPIAGGVPGFIQVLLIVVAVICWGDLFLSEPIQRVAAFVPARRVILAALLFSVSLSYVVRAEVQRKTYYSLTPLAFPGAEKIRLPAAQSRDYHWLVRNFHANCDVFFGMPELPSLHIWTNSPPPAGLGVDDWMVVYPDAEQDAISAELSRHPNACVFYNAQLVGFWNPSHENMDALPLARYINGNFKVVGNLDDFSFLVRKDRNIVRILSP